jgi:hypothetical protein
MDTEEVAVKLRKTLILMGTFMVLLAFVLIFESTGNKNAVRKEKQEKLVDLAAADIRKMELKNADGILIFEKDDSGNWRISSPVPTKADQSETIALAGDFADLKYERLVETDPVDLRTYAIPGKELALWPKGAEKPVRILFGMENPIDNTIFAKREDEKKVVLLPGRLKAALEKKLFDYRDKSVFGMETRGIRGVKVKAGAVEWESAAKDGGWELTRPVKALAGRSRMDALIESLSGLKAKEFVSETKTEEDIRRTGLDKPGYEVSLTLPADAAPIRFAFRKDGDRIFATGSLTDKIVLVESSILADLEKKPSEYREKKVAVFDSWEADRVAVTQGGMISAAVKEKAGDADKWRLETADKASADESRIETFIRKIEGLEAVEFVDAPEGPAAYGLDKPSAEIRIRVRGESGGGSREAVILVGRENSEKKQVFVKNPTLDYIFVVDSSFLQDLPKSPKSWTAETAPKAR